MEVQPQAPVPGMIEFYSLDSCVFMIYYLNLIIDSIETS